MSFSGKITSVEDLSAGNIKINLLGQDAAVMDFRVADGTQITGLEGNALKAGQLRKDMNVIVEYVSVPGADSKVISVQQTKFYEVDGDF
jgi:hypothetical protein